MKKMYEDWAVVAYRAPIDGNAAAVTLPSASTGIDMALWSELLFLLEFGVLAAGGSITNVISDSATTNGTYAAISGKTKTTDDVDDGFIYPIYLDSSELNAGARFVRLVQTPSAHAALLSVTVLGKAVNPPATDNKITAQKAVIE